ncbi:MAG: ubiG 1 [Gemmataceae bacterium]|nr:ubiG 1 [Gemmataceae bacterium]
MTPPPIRWETVPCPLCGAADDREFLRTTGDDGAEYRLGQCAACGMVFTNPRPDESSIARFYPEDYAPYQPPRKRAGGFRRALRARIGATGEKTLSDRIPVRPGGVLMDYGCGSGRFAARMRDRGWQAVGMDFSPHAVAAARKNFGLEVIPGTLPHSAVAAGSLDAVTLRAVLEHVHDPRRLLGAVSAALRPGGWVYASVPNLASWGYRAFGRAWFPLDPPRHLLHFTPETLHRVVEGCGFRVEAITTVGHTKWMGYSVDRAARENPRWWVRLCKFRPVRSALTCWTQWARQGDDLAVLARKPEGGARPILSRAAA